ncbi:MAG TPA: hypothetical protein VK911_13800 [Vicinamibacterales bacterium]|nr:hypothetical protein [Vicinamibacterales bacterium]
MLQRILSLCLVVVMAASGCATRAASHAAGGAGRWDRANGDGQIPASYLEQLPVGRHVEIRLQEGPRFKATFMGVEGDNVRLQPSGRIPVPPQLIPISNLAMVRLVEGGTSPGKALLIGVVTGAATFLGLLFISIAAWAD